MHVRVVQTCIRCRESKRQCDQAKPTCSRCLRAGVVCSFNQQQMSYVSPESNDNDMLYDPRKTQAYSQQPQDGARKRRNRACLSCTRCHRLKVKCDKKQPACGRCSHTGLMSTCMYTHKKMSQPRNPASPLIIAGEDPEAVVTTWFLRKRGSSHFRALLCRLESLSNLESSPFAMAVREHMEGDCSSDLTLPGNFPLGSPESARYCALETIHSLIQTSRPNCQNFIDNYLNLYQPIYPLLDAQTFQSEVDKFWENPNEVNLSWLAQFLVVLGLGAFATNQDIKPASDFFFASEACLAKTPFMFRPTILNIKTLCLMVLAKQFANATCWALDSCWNVMGVLVRLAVMMGLDQDGAPVRTAQDFHDETELRSRLWTIIVYLDIQLSLIAGQPSLLPPGALLSPSWDIPSPTTLDDCWESVLPDSLPIIYHFLNRINSGSDTISYNEVLQYDLEIRQVMRHIAGINGNSALRMSLDLFFRRALLCLHRNHALHEDAPSLYPTSYWSSLESSLAVLVLHREFAEHSCLSQNFELIGRVFMLDFFAAALTASIHLLRSDAPLAATLTSEGMIPPRQTILETLRSCLAIFSKEKNRSLCFRTGCHLLASVFKLIPGTSDEEACMIHESGMTA